MNKYMFCMSCGEEREVEIREEKEAYPVKNEPTEINAQVTYCKHCGEQIWNEELDEENLKEAYKQYRIVHGLLQPEDVKRIREKYNLTQTAFAKILGFGEKTIARYETGSIQDAAQNNLIELANYPNIFLLLLKKNENLITNIDYEKAEKALKLLMATIIVGEKAFPYQTCRSVYHYNTSNTNYFGGLPNVKAS